MNNPIIDHSYTYTLRLLVLLYLINIKTHNMGFNGEKSRLFLNPNLHIN